MAFYPPAFEALVDAFHALPGVGTKTARTLVHHLLKQDDQYIDNFVNRLKRAYYQLQRCAQCRNFSDDEICAICANTARDQTKLCIVSHIEDLMNFEQARAFDGKYFVLGAELSVKRNVTPDHLPLAQLRTQISNLQVHEVLMATSPTLEGEATAILIKNFIREVRPTLSVMRLGIGLPVNSQIDYADAVSLKESVYNRREMK